MREVKEAGAASPTEHLPLSMAAELLADQRRAESVRVRQATGLPAEMYALIVLVAFFTFALLVVGYELLPSDQTFA